jgi:hypothetical protein
MLVVACEQARVILQDKIVAGVNSDIRLEFNAILDASTLPNPGLERLMEDANETSREGASAASTRPNPLALPRRLGTPSPAPDAN